MAERAFMYTSTLGGSLNIPAYLQHQLPICFEYLAWFKTCGQTGKVSKGDQC